jgi:hypothetical protein
MQVQQVVEQLPLQQQTLSKQANLTTSNERASAGVEERPRGRTRQAVGTERRGREARKKQKKRQPVPLSLASTLRFDVLHVVYIL